MMTVLIFFLNFLAGGIRLFAGMFLICRLLSAEKMDRACVAAAFLGSCLLSVFCLLFIPPESFQRAFESIWITLCMVRLRHTDRRMSLFISIYYEIGMAFWQFLLAAGTGILFGLSDLPDTTGIYGQISLWTLHLCIIVLVCFIICGKMNGQTAFRLASGIAVAGLLAVVTLSVQTVLPIPDDTIFMWMIFAVILMAAVLMFHLSRQYEMERELTRLKSEQAELLERNYTALNRSYEANAKLFHDLHNHIGALRRLLSHEKYAKAIQYLDELKSPIQKIAETVWTGDETADYLINEKIKAASDKGIQTQVQVEFPRHAGIRSADLCTILGNLLDNALEAAGQVSAPRQRLIRLTIRRINQMLVIKVENSFSTAPVQKDGVLQTTKQEQGLHGWGLKSARTAAEKYDGMVRTSCEGTVFRTVVTLSWHGVSTETKSRPYTAGR